MKLRDNMSHSVRHRAMTMRIVHLAAFSRDEAKAPAR
jgi:hypothetical protein